MSNIAFSKLYRMIQVDTSKYLWYIIPVVHLMLSLLLAFTLAHHDDANPYGWHITCERWLQRSVEIRMDPNLDLRSKNCLLYTSDAADE